MITVLAGGDSFIWGSELADSPHGGPNGYSRKTFPALLSEQHQYICVAYPGIGNKEIANRIREALSREHADFVIVCWTWPSRDNSVNSDNCIQELQKYLEQKNIQYLFTCADNCVVTGNLEYKNWFFFPAGSGTNETNSPRGFYQWAVENKYYCGPDGHPLEGAHYDAATLMRGQFNELVEEHMESNSTRNSVST